MTTALTNVLPTGTDDLIAARLHYHPAPTPVAVQPRKRASMRQEEYDLLDTLIRAEQPQHTLEIGMANGGSTRVFCQAIVDTDGTSHTAIDPYQTHPDHWDSQGLLELQLEELDHCFELIEKPNYLALPQLIADGRSYDVILIDGWHSFDHTLLDMFFADKLLNNGGLLIIHDTCMPAVHKACRWLETHKPYNRVSPEPKVTLYSPIARFAKRIVTTLKGRAAINDARRRRNDWFTLAAYRKQADHLIPDNFHAPF